MSQARGMLQLDHSATVLGIVPPKGLLYRERNEMNDVTLRPSH